MSADIRQRHIAKYVITIWESILRKNIWKNLIMCLIPYLVQQIENNFIYPKVVGTAVNLPAIWAFVAIVIGGVLFGVVGMLFFIPMASVLYTLLKNDVNARLKKKAESVPVLPPVPPADGAE